MTDDSFDSRDTIEFDLESIDAVADDDSVSSVDSSAAWGDNPQRSRKRRIS
jgi:hypothetical protein